MNPTLLRGLTVLWTAAVACYKGYQAGNLDIVSILQSVDWGAVSAAILIGIAFIKRPGDVTQTQHSEAVTKAADVAYDQAYRDSMVPPK